MTKLGMRSFASLRMTNKIREDEDGALGMLRYQGGPDPEGARLRDKTKGYH
jgi:hypothetical protein